MPKTLLKVAAGINFAVGGFLILIASLIINLRFVGFFGVIIGGVSLLRLGIGAIFLYTGLRNDEEIKKYKWLILTGSIVSVITGHLISFILGLVAYSSIDDKVVSSPNYESAYTVNNSAQITKNTHRELTKEEKEQKRLKNLLALGTGLILLSGIIFATSSWNTLSALGKVIALGVASIVFFFISNLAETKFKLKASSVTYYILANSFLVVMFLAIGYFDLFGSWFSLNGGGVHLYISFLWLLSFGLINLAYQKYSYRSLIYVAYIISFMFMVSLLKFLEVGNEIILTVMIGIYSVGAVFKSENEYLKIFNNLTKMLLPVASFVLFCDLINLADEVSRIPYLAAFAFTFISSYYLGIINKNLFYQVFAPIFALITAFLIANKFNVDGIILILQFIVISAIVYLVGICSKKEKVLFNTTSVVCDLALCYVIFDALRLGYNYLAIIGAVLLLFTSVFVTVSKGFSKLHFELILEPVKVYILAGTIYELFSKFEFSEGALFISLLSLIFATISLFRKGYIKEIYSIAAVMTLIYVALFGSNGIATCVINVINSLILLIVSLKNEKCGINKLRELIYVTLLYAVGSAFYNILEPLDMLVFGLIGIVFAYLVLMILFKKNEIFRWISIVFLLAPYISLLENSNFPREVEYIFVSVALLSLIFSYTRGFLRTVDTKLINTIEIVALSIWYVITIFGRTSLEIVAFVGVISFISILIGFKSERWSSLYYTGIVFLVLNTIIQLREFWMNIPIWVYILVAGLVLVGLVTYKEYFKASREDKIEEVDMDKIDDNSIVLGKQILDTRAIVTGSIVVAFFAVALFEFIF